MMPYKILRFHFDGKIIFNHYHQVNIIQAVQFKYLPDIRVRVTSG